MTSIFATDPCSRGFPCGKRVRRSSWRRRPTDLARGQACRKLQHSVNKNVGPPPTLRRVRISGDSNRLCGVDLISDALPLGRLWYDGPNAVSNAIGYAQHDSRSADAVIRVYDDAGNLIETHEHKGE